MRDWSCKQVKPRTGADSFVLESVFYDWIKVLKSLEVTDILCKEVQCHHQDKAVDFCKRLRHRRHNPHENIYDQIKCRKHFKTCVQINKSTYLPKYKSTNVNKRGITHFVRTWRVHVYQGARNYSFSEILRTYLMPGTRNTGNSKYEKKTQRLS